MGYHNHEWELESTIEGQTALEYFAGLLDPELVLEVDTYWVAVGGQDPVEILASLGDRVKFIHIKDGPATHRHQGPAARRPGHHPRLDVIAAAKSLEVGVVEFDDYSGDIFEGIAESLAFLNAATSATHRRSPGMSAAPSTARGPVGVAVIGAGNISKQYLDNLTTFPDLKVLVIADLFEDAAEARAKEYGIAGLGRPRAALNHPDVEIIVNLTIPAAHVEVATAAVNAGQARLDREALLAGPRFRAGPAQGRRCRRHPPRLAPRTRSWAPACRPRAGIIERGDIGTPLTGMTTFQTPGPESWHPNPAFLFQHGAGPLFDMGPYYLTALVQTFGSIRKVAAVGSKAKDVRVIGSGPKAGEEFAVEVPTHVSAMAQFEGGAVLAQRFLLRVAAPADGLRGDHRHGSHASPCRTRTISTATSGSGAPATKNWTLIPATGPGQRPRHGCAGHGPRPSAPAFRTAPPAPSPTTCWTPWSRSSESVESGTFVDVESSAPASPALPEDWDPTASTL